MAAGPLVSKVRPIGKGDVLQSTEIQNFKNWPLNLFAGISFLTMGLISRAALAFGSMYEGLLSKLPLLSKLIYLPGFYLGVPSLLLFTWLFANIVWLRSSKALNTALIVLVTIGLSYQLLMMVSFFKPIFELSHAFQR